MGSSEPSEDTHDERFWGPFNGNFHKHIFYFGPDPDGNPATHDDAGTLDGQEAFQYCGATLKQTPQTPVFFSIDFDPYDIRDPNNPPATPPPPPPPPPAPAPVPSAGWPALPAIAAREQMIKTYFANIKTARDAFATRTGRHYLIGVYGNGRIMKVLYDQGIVSHFWQAGSSGRSGNRPPAWPWFHVNRWQYQGNQPYCGIPQVDPDADWGDGGTWSLADPLAQDLAQLERIGIVGRFAHWGDLVVPPPPPPPPP
jgi:hypothetical protein